jgi:DNA (cytosine-5)-methyltransferase 1
MLQATSKPYVIENVPGAPLRNPITLCGTMFDLLVIRHRIFETNPPLYWPPAPCRHTRPVVKCGRPPDPDKHYHSVIGNFSNVAFAQQAMGIDWMTQDELAQAIPPAYTEWIGKQLLKEM